MLDGTKEATDMQSRYELAQQVMTKGTLTPRHLVLNATLIPYWIAGTNCFWYQRETKNGKEFRLVDASTASNEIAFDHVALANALCKASGETAVAEDLPISRMEMNLSPLEIRFTAFEKRWLFDVAQNACKALDVPPEHWLIAPDGSKAAFIRDDNIWLHDLETGAEKALTRDGEPNNSYGAVPAANGEGLATMALQAVWSPDSRRLFTLQLDTRQVKSMPSVHHVPKDGSIRPRLVEYRTSMPGDEHVPVNRLLSIDVETGKSQEACYRPVPVCRFGFDFFTEERLGWWGADSRRAWFIDMGRGDRWARVVEFDTATGITRVLFEETCDTYISLSLNMDDAPAFTPLPESNELLWYSERSGWAHFYLYDLETGELKHPVTQGEWVVREVLHFDPETRELYLQTSGREPDRDPYYLDICRVNIDTGELATIASSNDEYLVLGPKCLAMFYVVKFGHYSPGAGGVSPDGCYLVTTRSRADRVPVSLLLDKDGRQIMELETADASGLPDGWQWPEPVRMTAADGETDIYGLIFRPADFSPDRHYPVIDVMFSLPEAPFVAKGSFSNALLAGFPYHIPAAFAQLGCIAVTIDSRGSAHRHKAFHDHSYGWVADATYLPDHIAAIQQLAERYPCLDLDRVGAVSMGSSAGPVYALVDHPDFFKVGSVWNMPDARLGLSFWSDHYEGPAQDPRNPRQAEYRVRNLQGKLLLMSGMLDTVFPPAGTLRLVEALQKANKDFDLIMMPNLGHQYSAYIIRRTWDHFVRHLLGEEPPTEFKLTANILYRTDEHMRTSAANRGVRADDE